MILPESRIIRTSSQIHWTHKKAQRLRPWIRDLKRVSQRQLQQSSHAERYKPSSVPVVKESATKNDKTRADSAECERIRQCHVNIDTSVAPTSVNSRWRALLSEKAVYPVIEDDGFSFGAESETVQGEEHDSHDEEKGDESEKSGGKRGRAASEGCGSGEA